MRLSTRFFLILFLFAITPLLAVDAWMINSTEVARANAMRLHQQLARMAADLVESAAADMNRSLSFVEDLERLSKGSALEVLQRAAAEHPSLVLLSIVGPDGRETTRLADAALFAQALQDRSRDPLILQTRRSGRASLRGPVWRGGEPIMLVAHSLRDGRIAIAGYSLSALWRRLSRVRVGAHGRLLLLGRDGRPLPGLGGGFPQADWSGPGKLGSASGWLEDVKTKAGTMAGAYVLAPSFGLRALTLQPRAEAYAKPEGFFVKALAILALVILLVALVAIYASARITRPLQILAVAANRAATNDLNVSVPRLGWGELDDVGRAFNHMLKQLRQYQALQVEQLLVEKAKVDGLVQGIPDGIVLAGFDGSVLYVNAVARKLLGESARRDHPRLRELLREGRLRDAVLGLLAGKRREGHLDAELETPEGQRTFACRAAIIGADGRDTGILLLMRDATAEKQLERMKEEFFHCIVHDLRNPISAIDGFAKLLLQRGDLPAQDRGYVDFMLRSTEKLRELVKDILDLAKLESGTMTLAKDLVTVPRIFETIRQVFAVQAQEKAIALRLEPGPAPHELTCDAKLIERVLMNLV
ncbi:MAG: HAMP domain-containing protein, partial [Elusimicrobia bacterium]|nr:HAMP domain-containing protein [Elusimicrobiota bacterium]